MFYINTNLCNSYIIITIEVKNNNGIRTKVFVWNIKLQICITINRRDFSLKR